MWYLIMMMLYAFLSTSNYAFAQNQTVEQPKPPAAVTTPKPPMSELTILGEDEKPMPQDYIVKMGKSLHIKATGVEYVEAMKKELTKTGASKAFTLYLDGVPMAGLPSWTVQNLAKTELIISFDLIRDANKDDNRKAWDTLLKKQEFYEMNIQAAIAVGADLPWAVKSPPEFQFRVASLWKICVTFSICIVIFLVAYYQLVTRTSMLRDESTGYFSLGKSQMAFWGLLVLLTFAGVWIVTGTMERIPPQTLILLGISGATGLSAIVIGNSKKEEIQTQINKLRKDGEDLQAKQPLPPAPASPDDIKNLAEIKAKIDTLSKQLGPGDSKGFWWDICDDNNGLSFHRMQVVLWTIVLGAVFVGSVAQMMSIPEFSDTLLILMGISNATYLGFKIPEKA